MAREKEEDLDTPKNVRDPDPPHLPGDEGYLTEADHAKPKPAPITGEGENTIQVGDKVVKPTGPLPDRNFRDAWQLEGEVVKVDPVKAKQLVREVIRREREGRMTRLDNKWMMFMGKKDQVKADEVEARRQKLRDATADNRLNSNDPAVLKTAMETIVTEMESEASA